MGFIEDIVKELGTKNKPLGKMLGEDSLSFGDNVTGIKNDPFDIPESIAIKINRQGRQTPPAPTAPVTTQPIQQRHIAPSRPAGQIPKEERTFGFGHDVPRKPIGLPPPGSVATIPEEGIETRFTFDGTKYIWKQDNSLWVGNQHIGTLDRDTKEFTKLTEKQAIEDRKVREAEIFQKYPKAPYTKEQMQEPWYQEKLKERATVQQEYKEAISIAKPFEESLVGKGLELLDKALTTAGTVASYPFRTGRFEEFVPPQEFLPGGREYETYLKWKGDSLDPSIPVGIPSWKQSGAYLNALGLPFAKEYESPDSYEMARMGLAETMEFGAFILAGGAIGKTTRSILSKANAITKKYTTVPMREAFITKAENKLLKQAAKEELAFLGEKAPILAKIEKIWVEEAKKATGDFAETTATFWRVVEEKLLDKFAGINKMTTKARNQWKKTHPTEEFPIVLDAELHAANLGGSAAAGIQRATDAWTKMKVALGKHVPYKFVDEYLILKHQLDVIAMHPQRIITAGLKNIREINLGLKQMEVLLGKEAFASVESAAKEITNHWAAYLQRGVDSGLISKKLAGELRKKYPNYNPIAYIDRIVAEQSKGMGRALSVTQNDIKALSDMGSNALRERPLDTLARLSLKKEILIQRNNAAKAIANLTKLDETLRKQVAKLPLAQRGSLSYMDKGKLHTVAVPKWLEVEAKLLGQMGFGDLERLGMAVNDASRFGMTSANLAFFIPNFGVDTLTAMLTYGVGPARILKRLALNLKDIIKEDKVLAAIRRSGGEVFGFWGKRPDVLAKEAKDKGILVLQNQSDWKKLLKNPFETITRIGHAVEMTPRSAIFELELQRGKLLEYAALAARRGTIDFQRSGTAVRQANALFLYLNAGVQGSMIPFRALRDFPRSRFYTAGYAAATVGQYAWNRQFPEYEDVPDFYKYGAFPVMLPSEEYDKRGNKVPHYILVIPNTREWAAFSGPITYALRKLDKQSPGDVGQFLEAWLPQLNPISQIAGQGGSVVPTQAAKAIYDVTRNHDSFRGRNIVPEELVHLPPAEQFNEWTTHTARRVGEAIGYSPMKIDFFVRNIFGGLGSQFMTAMDGVIGVIEGEGGDPRIQLMLMQLEGIQETAEPDKIPSRRQDYLESLSPEDRKAVLSLEMTPDKRIPIFSNIMNRIYKERGGQIYQTAKRNIENMLTTDNSMETAQEELNNNALQNALNFTNGLISAGQYRDILSDHRTFYRGRTAEVWRVRELSGAIATADVQPYLPEEYQWKPEERALHNYHQVIDTLFTDLAGVETDETVSMVWRQVDAYVDSLSPELKDYVERHKSDWINELPQEAQLVQRMYDSDIKYLGDTGYWDIPTMTEQRENGMRATDLRGQARKENPEIDARLAFWFDYITKVKTQEAMNILLGKANSLGRPYNAIPAVSRVIDPPPSSTSRRSASSIFQSLK